MTKPGDPRNVGGRYRDDWAHEYEVLAFFLIGEGGSIAVDGKKRVHFTRYPVSMSTQQHIDAIGNGEQGPRPV